MGLAFFHWSEYQATAMTNQKALTLESFLLDHSREYKLAALASCFEFILEGYFFPGDFYSIYDLVNIITCS